VVQDLAAVEAACRELGLTFMRGQTTQKYYGGTSKCLHAIRVPGTDWEIGLLAAKTGKGFELAYDNYGTSGQTIAKRLGNGLEKLKQGYAVAKAAIEAKARGWLVQKNMMPSGAIKLTLTGAM
jgi:hypothetical protein